MNMPLPTTSFAPAYTGFFSGILSRISDFELQDRLIQRVTLFEESLKRGNMNKALVTAHNLVLDFPPHGGGNDASWHECQKLYMSLLEEYDRISRVLLPGEYTQPGVRVAKILAEKNL